MKIKFIFYKVLFSKLDKLLGFSYPFRKIILISFDSLLIFLSFSATLFIVQPELKFKELIDVYLIINAILFAIYFKTNQYQNFTRYINSFYAYNLLFINLICIFIFIIFNSFILSSILSLKTIFLFYLFLSLSLCFLRFSVRDLITLNSRILEKSKKKVVIYGAGKAGLALNASLRQNDHYSVIAFVDDNKGLWKRKANGIKIYPASSLGKVIDNFDVDQVLLAIPSLKAKRKSQILRYIQSFGVKVLKIPSIEEITSGNVPIEKLSPISTGELLGRESVKPFDELIQPGINNLNVCVVGAGGSIGSELCRQMIKYKPNKIILFEISEPSLYQINQELLGKNQNNSIEIIPILGNVSDQNFVKKVFQKHSVQIVFHAAAYKHVPLVEDNPISGISNNITSTITVCDVAQELELLKVIYISTDKAVRPTNIMGASKRLCELIISNYASNVKDKKTIFSMVRFGNVLGSSGSVVPLFNKQISDGGPITLTDINIIRYFMTMEEASQLVLQSSVIAKGGEVFLLDMGEPVKIFELAKQMISLRGLSLKNEQNPNGDIEIVCTGLRAGEKLYEELLIDGKCEKTVHPLIFKAFEKNNIDSKFESKLLLLRNHLMKNDEEMILTCLSELVPNWSTSLLR